MRDVLAGRGRVPYGDMDDTQLHELRDTMRQVCPASPPTKLRYRVMQLLLEPLVYV